MTDEIDELQAAQGNDNSAVIEPVETAPVPDPASPSIDAPESVPVESKKNSGYLLAGILGLVGVAVWVGLTGRK